MIVCFQVLVLTESSVTYHRWVAPDQPLFFEVFLFNWTNPSEFPKEKPKFQEIGPYRFREIRKHVNVTVHHNNSTIAYRTQRSWYYDDSSNGSLEDIVTTINMLAASGMFQKRHAGFFQSLLLSGAFGLFNVQLPVTKTVGEMLFEGFEDSLLTASKVFPLPEGAPKMDKFGWFVTRNNSIDTDGYMEVSSGEDGSLLGQIRKWNYQETMPYFQGNCSKMSGSAGEFITRDLTENSTLTMFVPDLCRTLDLEQVDSGVMRGLDYYKFELVESCFDKSSVSDKNSCYCNGECKWSGVMNVSACRFDSPTFLSLPHFLYGDPALRDAVEGMAPDPEKHSFYFKIEPTLGVPIDVAGRFQFNVYLEPSSHVSLFKNVPNMLFPVFWVQQHVIVTDDIFTELRVVVALSRWGGLFFAVLAIISAAVAVVCSSRKPKYISISTG